MTNNIKVPPDGGWGWVIAAGQAMFFSIITPFMNNFGLIFKHKLNAIGLQPTDIAIIINVNAAVKAWLGAVAGPSLHLCGFRKMAFYGAFLFVFGFFMTIFVNNFTSFLVLYGIIVATGTAFGGSAVFVAINSYFVKYRNRANGLSWTVSSIGPILFPPLIVILISNYGTIGCILILTAISMHLFVVAMVLQPLEWHLVDEKAEDQTTNANNQYGIVPQMENKKIIKNFSDKCNNQANVMTRKCISFESLDRFNFKQIDLIESKCVIFKTYSEILQTIKEEEESEHFIVCNKLPLTNEHYQKLKINENIRKKYFGETAVMWLADIFGLTLLTDIVFVNTIIGVSLADFSDMNFGAIAPFILMDFNYSLIEIAAFQSTTAIAEIMARFVSPFIGEYLQQPPRLMFIYAMIISTFFRMSLFFISSYTVLLVIGVIIGIGSGITCIYWNVVVPNSVSIDRIAAASGIQAVVVGLMLIGFGPLIGQLREISGSYFFSALLMSGCSFLCVVIWTIEYLYFKFK